MWPHPVAHLHWPITRSYPIKTWPPSSNTSPLAHQKAVPHKNWPPSSGTSLLAYHEAIPLKNVTLSSGTSPLAYHEADYPNGIFTDSELEANDSSWGSFDRWGDFSTWIVLEIHYLLQFLRTKVLTGLRNSCHSSVINLFLGGTLLTRFGKI